MRKFLSLLILLLSGTAYAAGGTLKIGHQFMRINEKTPGMWQDYEFGTPGKYAEYVEDFFTYTTGDWTVSEIDGAATEALATAAPTVGGVLLITNTNADNDAVSMQKVGHSFVPTANSKIFCEFRFQISEVTQSDYLFGLVVTDTTPLANTDGVYFRKDDGDTNLDFETNASSTASTEAGIRTAVADTYLKVGFKISGTTLVEYYVNDKKEGEFTTNIPTAPLRLTLHTQDGDTGGAVGAETTSVDYAICAQERPGF